MIEQIKKHINNYESKKRHPISVIFPFLIKPIIFLKKSLRSSKNFLTLKKLERKDFLPSVIARHSSLLYRKLGDSDAELQKNKVTNLKIAIEKLNGLVIPSGETFSFWYAVGGVSREKGYTDGMLLSNGKVIKGLGGGLCQLSNFLFWILLHTDVEIIERYHHSVDVFPDSGRTLPFGGGATVFDNYIDLKIKNISKHPIQLKLWLTEDCLKGQVLSDSPSEFKFHILEKEHCFIRRGEKYFRYNNLFREKYKQGVRVDEENLLTNFAPVMYPVTSEYLNSHGYILVDL